MGLMKYWWLGCEVGVLMFGDMLMRALIEGLMVTDVGMYCVEIEIEITYLIHFNSIL